MPVHNLQPRPGLRVFSVEKEAASGFKSCTHGTAMPFLTRLYAITVPLLSGLTDGVIVSRTHWREHGTT